MKRFARIVPYLVTGGLAAMAAPAHAQTAAGSDTSRYYGEVNGGLTVGHQTSGSVGGEFGYRIRGPYTVFAEVGRMMNVGTKALDNRARPIAEAVGATFDAQYKATYFDVGLRYTPNYVFRMLHPYVTIGAGFASVRAKTEFQVNGSGVPPESLGILLGDDLDGTVNKGLLTVGGGVTYPFAKRYFIDGSYRYGRIFSSNAIEDDKGINTSRLQIGAGVRF